MKRHLMWIVAGTAAVGLAAPAYAVVQSGGTRGEQPRRSGRRAGHDVTSTSSKKGSMTSAARGLTGP
jgi:hypothetical protein